MCHEPAPAAGRELVLSIDWQSPEGLVLRGLLRVFRDRGEPDVEQHVAPLSLRGLLDALPHGHPLGLVIMQRHREAVGQARRAVRRLATETDEARDRRMALIMALGEAQTLG